MSSRRLTSSAGAVAEADVLRRRLAAVEPAHDVGAHALERVVGGDQVAPRAVHLAPVGVEQLLVGEHLPVGRTAGQHHRHEEQRVEPQPDLLAHLGHPVGREPPLPVLVVGQVGSGEAGGRAGRVAGLDERRVLPAQGRERARCRRPATHRRPPGPGARRRRSARSGSHRVDPRAVQLLQGVEPGHGARLELRARADHVHAAAVARVERQRQPVEAPPGDVPVPHVAQPVLHALAVLRRRPLDAPVLLDHPLAHALHADVPVVGDAEDQRRVAAPAVRIRVHHRARVDQRAALAQGGDDRLAPPRRCSSPPATRRRDRSARSRRRA